MPNGNPKSENSVIREYLRGNSTWKFVTTILLAILGTFLTVWFTLANNVVTADQFEKVMDKHVQLDLRQEDRIDILDRSMIGLKKDIEYIKDWVDEERRRRND